MKRILAGCCLILALTLAGAEIKLMDNGKPVCSIVPAGDAGAVEKHAASELAACLARITGGEAPAVNSKVIAGKLPVYLKLSDDKELQQEGFRIEVSSQDLTISAGEPVGLLYGVYEILKVHGGIRWLFPGKDGEYFTVKPTITLPEGKITRNPSSRVRTIMPHCMRGTSAIPDTWDWLVRNNMRISIASSNIPANREELAKRAAVIEDGRHAFTQLLVGTAIKPGETWGNQGEFLKKLYAGDINYFPLIGGKRVMLGDHRFQPCTTYPGTIDRMAENLCLWVERFGHLNGARFVIGNDDGTGWCQCDNCRRLDPETEKKQGFVSTRYWTLINELVKRVHARYPHADLWGWAYQNFQKPPEGLRPNPAVPVMETYNRRCYRHALEDPKCPTNQLYYRYFKQWSALGNPSSTWEEIGPTAGSYLPIEKVFAQNLKTFHQLKVGGCMPAIAPPDGHYSARYDNTDIPRQMIAGWQTFYLMARLLWDIERNADAELEEAGKLYYGSAWGNGMRQYRELLIKTFEETPGCFGHGQSPIQIGRCLNTPEAREKLLALLDQAEKAVQNDPRALKHVRTDREFFTGIWIKYNQEYRNTFREMKAYRRKGSLNMDGLGHEEDWKNAEVYSNFQTGPGKNAVVQTYFRAVYEPDYLYFFIEAVEPEINKMYYGPAGFFDANTLEVFITHPDFNNGYYHLAINPKGEIYEARNTPGQSSADRGFKTGVEAKTSVSGDRWTAEIKIPTQMLGLKCFDDSAWRINVARGRLTGHGIRESSSISGGAFHGADHFMPLAFAGNRQTGYTGEIDQRFWKNSSLNETGKRLPGKNPNWQLGANDLYPAHWSLSSGGTGRLEMVPRPGSSNDKDYCVKLLNGFFFQLHYGTDKKYKVKLEASGKGTFQVMALRYTREPLKSLPTKIIGEVTVDSESRKNFEYEFEKEDANEVTGFAIRHLSGEILLDNIQVFAIP